MITSSSPAPLLFAWGLFLLCGAASAAAAVVFVVASVLSWQAVNLYWLATSAVSGLFSALFLSVGILGQYAAKVLMRLGGTPPYVVAETSSDPAED